KSISHLFKEHTILGPKSEKPATRAFFLQLASDAHIVLYTGHSVGGDIRRAYLQLSSHDKLSLIEQFVLLNLPQCSLWDYSSCETALPKFKRADEWITLASAPLCAGARTVWSTLWAVNDFAAAQLKQRAYENLLLKGMNKVRALNEAQRAFVRGELPVIE